MRRCIFQPFQVTEYENENPKVETHLQLCRFSGNTKGRLIWQIVLLKQVTM